MRQVFTSVFNPKRNIRAVLTCLLIVLSFAGFAQTSVCDTNTLATMTFAENSSQISPEMGPNMSAVAEHMNNAPGCKVIVAGNSGGTKFDQQLSWDRVNNIIESFSEKYNIDRARFIFIYDAGSSEGVPTNAVKVRGAADTEDGPSNVAPPHPRP